MYSNEALFLQLYYIYLGLRTTGRGGSLDIRRLAHEQVLSATGQNLTSSRVSLSRGKTGRLVGEPRAAPASVTPDLQAIPNVIDRLESAAQVEAGEAGPRSAVLDRQGPPRLDLHNAETPGAGVEGIVRVGPISGFVIGHADAGVNFDSRPSRMVEYAADLGLSEWLRGRWLRSYSYPRRKGKQERRKDGLKQA